MNHKKLMGHYPKIRDDLRSEGIEWNPQSLTKEFSYKDIDITISVFFTKKSKNIPKEIQIRINELKNKINNLSNYIDNVYNQYSLLTINQLKNSFREFKISDSIEKYQESVTRKLELKSLKKEKSYFENINDYPDIFYKARQRKRKIIAYLGETNSGKTFNAMSQLADSFNGAYLAPLRLLAYENFDYLNNRGIETNLVTGEEKINVSKVPQCISATVECFNFEKHFDTVVIDEIQMIDDNDRGPFFIQALIGANADNVIVTGPPAYENRLREIADELNEEIEVHNYERKTQIKPLKKPVSIKEVPKNTAIVVFSRKDVFKVRDELPSTCKTSMIYGALGHEVRNMQAKKFIDGETDVLITTDAIGMGMNLPIENIIFYNYKKFDGRSFGPLSGMLTKQICGRCGRYGIYDVGYYGGMDKDTSQYIRETMNNGIEVPDKKFNVLPTKHYIETMLKHYSLSAILKNWSEVEKFPKKGMFVNANLDNKIKIARFLENKYPEKVKEYFNLINCPVDYEQDVAIFNSLVHQMFKDAKFTIPEPRPEHASLSDLEVFVRHCNIILWFSNQFPEFCKEGENEFQENIKNLIKDTNKRLDKRLSKSNVKK